MLFPLGRIAQVREQAQIFDQVWSVIVQSGKVIRVARYLYIFVCLKKSAPTSDNASAQVVNPFGASSNNMFGTQKISGLMKFAFLLGHNCFKIKQLFNDLFYHC